MLCLGSCTMKQDLRTFSQVNRIAGEDGRRFGSKDASQSVYFCVYCICSVLNIVIGFMFSVFEGDQFPPNGQY